MESSPPVLENAGVTARVLVAEDDRKQAELIRRYFEREGHVVTVVHDGVSALDTCRRLRPDVAVLDGMLPHLDGLDVCRTVRAESDIPILMLTARSTEDDVLRGLDHGADDYLTKPFSPRELVARVHALLRRSQRSEPPSQILRLGQLTIDIDRHLVTLRDRTVECTPAEFAILTTLAARPGRTHSRQALLLAAFGSDHGALERTIDVHVKNLRRKIEDDPGRPTSLLTVYGVGYKFAEPSPSRGDDRAL